MPGSSPSPCRSAASARRGSSRRKPRRVRPVAACARRGPVPCPPRRRRRRPRLRGAPGSSSAKAASPAGTSGLEKSRVVESQRSWPYWPRTSEPRAGRQDVGDLLQPTELDHLASRAAGDEGDRAHVARPRPRAQRARRMDHGSGRVGHDRCQRAVEVQAHDRVAGDGDHGVVPTAHLRAEELHVPSQPRIPPAAFAGDSAGQDDRQPVEPHRRDRGPEPVDPEVLAEQPGLRLQPRRVVHGARRDGAVPVVGADDLPARARGRAAVLPRQPGDPGVVVDLDVGPVTADRGLLALASPPRRPAAEPRRWGSGGVAVTGRAAWTGAGSRR